MGVCALPVCLKKLVQTGFNGDSQVTVLTYFIKLNVENGSVTVTQTGVCNRSQFVPGGLQRI